MGRKYLKILTSCLSLTSVVGLSACSFNTKNELESIEIVSTFNDLSLEVNETYDSKPIEIKCYDINKKEISSKTQLFLYPLTDSNMDISIEDNQIHIGTNKDIGQHKYQIIAKSIDGTIESDPKNINIYVYKNKIVPDSIELNGSENELIYFPTSKEINYEIIGKKDGQIIDDFDSKVNIDLIINSTTGLSKDLFSNPLFTLKQKDKIISLSISENIDNIYQGKYTLQIRASLCSNPNIYAIKQLELNLIYGLSFYDQSSNYFYDRKDINSEWSLKSIPSSKLFIEKSKIPEKIYDAKVTCIGNNFCNVSQISSFIRLELPDCITAIDDYAFYKQEALGSIFIQNIEYVGDYAFANCPMATVNPVWPLKLKTIGKCAFMNCSEFEPRYLNEIEYIGESSLRGIYSSEIHFGSKIKIIGPEALFDCPNLTNIYINNPKPPQLLGSFIGGSCPVNIKIHVPITSLQIYLNAPNWGNYQQNLVGDITM